MEPLTANNTRVKEARKLSRRSVRTERRLMLVEGWKGIEAARDLVVEVFATPAAAAEHQALLAPHDVILVDDRALTSLTDAVSPQGLVAVCRSVDVPLEDAVAAGRDSGLLVLCADVRDPGNAGTVVRTADAVGAGAVVLAGDSVDVANPKTLRASVGSVFHLPVAVERDPVRAVAAAQDAGLTVLAADGAGDVDLLEADALLERPVAWLFGNEAWGLPGDLAAAADHRVRIPILGRAESLNLATAAAVCLYASARVRQRAASSGGTAPA